MYSKGEFCNYLLSFKVEKGTDFTHTSIVKPSGAFFIPEAREQEFIERYRVAMHHGEELYLTEKHKELSPIIIDLDFRHDPACETRQYTLATIQKIVNLYVNAVTSIFDTHEFSVYVMEKPMPCIDKGIMKDGLHMVIPEVVSSPAAQLIVRDYVIEHMFDLDIHLVNTPQDIIDEAVITRNNWQMYGSKKPNGEPYKITHIYKYVDGAIDELPIETDHTRYVSRLSIRNKAIETPVKIEWQEVMAKYSTKPRKMDPRLSKVNNKQNTCDSLELAKKLVAILAPSRAEKYDLWIRLGWCLRNIDYRLLEDWVEFSKKSPKFREGECEKTWNMMREDGLGLGTLHMWAKQDNPEQYKKILEHDLNSLVYRSASDTHHDIARVVHFLYRYEYVCASIKQNYWFEFKNHRWSPCDSGHSLRSRISVEVFRVYTQAAAFYSQKASMEEAEADQQRYAEIAKKLNSIALKLKQTPFKDNILKECREMFYMEKFEEKLDSKCELIGFENGVYDLEVQEFREGRPEDYISFSTGINYIHYDPDHPDMRAVIEFFEKVFTNPEVREYVLRLLASFLNGHIKEERFHIWTGVGCFAKDTQIMMADGSLKKVQDILVGDQLMGDDSQPRNVLELKRGYSDMYEVIPIKGDKFVVNGMHVLVIKAGNMIRRTNKGEDKVKISWAEYDKDAMPVMRGRSKTVLREDYEKELAKIKALDNTVNVGDVFDITVHDYLLLSNRIKAEMKMYRPDFVEFPEKEVKMDPYALGYWLGNGTSREPQFTTMDQEVVDEYERLYGDVCNIKVYADKGKAKTYGLSMKKDQSSNKFSDELKHYGLFQNKHVPEDFKLNSKEVRMRLLAGLIDSDGHYHKDSNDIQITLELEHVIDDIVFIARSLGIAAYKYEVQKTCTNTGTYYMTTLHGVPLHEVPCLVPRKQALVRKSKVDPLSFSFKVERIEDGDFYGFELDGNHRFLGEDFTVLHNSNGKSKCVELFEQSFGDYCCKFPITLLTQKRAASNAATSELARAKGKRFASLQEPSEDEKLNIGLMKELSGGDKIMARALFKDAFEFKPQFKMVLCCNHLPNVPSDDGGTWRRIRVVEFSSQFKMNPDPNNPKEFLADLELSQKFGEWREHFMALLIQKYALYREHGIFEPDDVLKCTKEYQRNNDAVLEFLEQEIMADERGFVSANDVFTKFQYWIKDNAPYFKISTKKALVTAAEKTMGKTVAVHKIQGWKGFAFKQDKLLEESDDLDP